MEIFAQWGLELQDALQDPTRIYLFLGPVVGIVAITALIGIVKLLNRQRTPELGDTKPVDKATTSAPSSVSPQDEITSREAQAPEAESWLTRLADGLKKTRDNLSGSLGSLFSGGPTLTSELKENLHEVLFRADLGVNTANKLVEKIEADSKGENVDWSFVQTSLRKHISEILSPLQTPIKISPTPPTVILIVGVNGVGKTTTVAKLAASFMEQGRSVLLCAADTYRAAAIDQLKVWGERLDVDVIAHQQGSDPAAVAYDGVKAAIARGVDILLIDTAGRLHNKKELMDELAKINRVIGKDKPGAPHETWLVIDATTGQNALQQVRHFRDVVPLSGLVVTKLDGTAKGGVLIAAADQYQLPIRYIGVGEKAQDLQPFVVDEYVGSLL